MENKQNVENNVKEEEEISILYPVNLLPAIFGSPSPAEEKYFASFKQPPEELIRLVDEKLNTLPEKERTAILLYFRDKNTFKEIAVKLKTKPYYVQHLYIARGLRKMRHPSRSKCLRRFLPYSKEENKEEETPNEEN